MRIYKNTITEVVPNLPYVLYDSYGLDVTAGNINNSYAIPTPSQRVVTDTGNNLTILSGLLKFAGNVASGNPGLWYNAIPRTNGQILAAVINLTSGTGTIHFGFDTSAAGGLTSGARITNNKFTSLENTSAGPTLSPSLTTGVDYKIIIIMRSTGFFFFVKGGTLYPNWTLLWVSSDLNTASMLPSIVNTSAVVFSFSKIRMPRFGWLPTPIASDSFNRANGAIGNTDGQAVVEGGGANLVWTGSTYTISSNAAINTPTLGSELLTNGNFEGGFTLGLANNWTAQGTPAATQETTIVHGGTSAQKLVSTSSSDGILQNVNTNTNLWYLSSAWVYALTSGTVGLVLSANATATSSVNNAYQNLIATSRGTASRPLIRVNANLQTIYIDDCSSKALTTSELFSSVVLATSDVITSVGLTLSISGSTIITQAGLVVNLDSAASPQNFVIAYHDGTTAKLDKCVAGVYTNVISAAATYSAGAVIRVIKNGTNYGLYYNGSIVGAISTISDAGIISNNLHGLFSTYSGDSLDNFNIFANGANNEFAILNKYI